jgi:hypothetical protein
MRANEEAVYHEVENEGSCTVGDIPWMKFAKRALHAAIPEIFIRPGRARKGRSVE